MKSQRQWPSGCAVAEGILHLAAIAFQQRTAIEGNGGRKLQRRSISKPHRQRRFQRRSVSHVRHSCDEERQVDLVLHK